MDPMTMMLLGGALGGGLGSLFGMNAYKDPSAAGMPYLNQMGSMYGNMYAPYMGMGNQALNQMPGMYGNMMGQGQGLQNLYGQMSGIYPELKNQYSSMAGMLPGLQGEYGKLMTDPGAIISKLGGGFQQSPGYKWQTDQAMNAVNRAGAAGGTLGTPMAQQHAAEMVGGLANQDYQNYMNRAQGLYGAGLQGTQGLVGQGTQGLANLFGTGVQGQQGMFNQGLGGMAGLGGMGWQAAQGLGGDLGNLMMNQALMRYLGAQGQNQNVQGGLGNIFSMFGVGAGGLGSLFNRSGTAPAAGGR